MGAGDPIQALVIGIPTMVKKGKSKQVAVVDLRVQNGGVNPSKRRRRRRRAALGTGMWANSTRALAPISGRVGAPMLGKMVPAGYAAMNPSTSLGFSQRGDVSVIRRCELFSEEGASSSDEFTAPVDGAIIPAKVPWLAGVAQNFSKWRWVSLRMKYMPLCPTTTPGSIGYGFGYDMAESAPSSLLEVASFDQFHIHAPWTTDDAGCVFDVGRFSRDWYPYIGETAFGQLATGAERNIYSPGYFSVYVPASTTTGLLGAIFIDYVVELCDPISATLQPS